MGDTSAYREGRKDGPTKCTWYPGHPGPSPHTHYRSERPKKILDSVDQFIGETPMVRLNRIPQQEGVECEVVAKCEFFNAGGSVKDRIGKVCTHCLAPEVVPFAVNSNPRFCTSSE